MTDGPDGDGLVVNNLENEGPNKGEPHGHIGGTKKAGQGARFLIQ
jgi:hypothetical protein